MTPFPLKTVFQVLGRSSAILHTIPAFQISKATIQKFPTGEGSPSLKLQFNSDINVLYLPVVVSSFFSVA
jgi:hypothetical protein